MSKFQTWDEFRKELNFTEEEEEEIRIEGEIIEATIEARKEKKLTQTEISQKSGLTQSAIARIENGTHSPNMQTMIKYLHAIGYTLQVVPAKNSQAKKSSKQKGLQHQAYNKIQNKN